MKKLIVITLCTLSTAVFAVPTTGLSTFPWQSNKKILSTELNGIADEQGGAGLTARFTNKLNEQISWDAAVGITRGDRAGNMVSVATDYEFYPDYAKQPRFAIRGSMESTKEFNERTVIIGLSPTLSKGFSFWGHEAFPHLSLPMGLVLNGPKSTYETRFNLNVGITGKIPHPDYQNLTAKLEGSLGLKDSYSSVLLGISYSIN